MICVLDVVIHHHEHVKESLLISIVNQSGSIGWLFSIVKQHIMLRGKPLAFAAEHLGIRSPAMSGEIMQMKGILLHSLPRARTEQVSTACFIRNNEPLLFNLLAFWQSC